METSPFEMERIDSYKKHEAESETHLEADMCSFIVGLRGLLKVDIKNGTMF